MLLVTLFLNVNIRCFVYEKIGSTDIKSINPYAFVERENKLRKITQQ